MIFRRTARLFLFLVFPVLPVLPAGLAAPAPVNAPANAPVLAAGTHAFPHLMPGKTLKTYKVWHYRRKSIELRGDIPAAAGYRTWMRLAREERSEEMRRFGGLAGRLRDRFQRLRDEERVRVLITLRYPQGWKHPSKLRHSADYLEEHGRQVASLRPVTRLDAFFGKHGLGLPVGMGPAEGICELPKHKLREIMFDPDVAAIEEFAAEDPTQNRPGLQVHPDLVSLARSAYHHADLEVPGTAGEDVHAATFELGLEEAFLKGIGVAPEAWGPIPGFDPGKGNHIHSLLTFRCLTQAAPGARFYHRESVFYLGETPWIVGHGIQTASLSYSRRHGYTPASQEFRQMDDLAYRYPFPVFVTGTGNEGWTLESQWLPYNAISVGNVQHHRQKTFQIGSCPPGPDGASPGCTRTRNPPAVYGGDCLRAPDRKYSFCSSDREMPHLVVPGFTPTSDPTTCAITPMRSSCLPTENIWCGTSLSAPVANGLAAAVIAADPRMVSWPEKVRAALLLTAENVDAGEWSSAFDGRDGAGVVNGAAAVAFARNHADVLPGDTAVAAGMGAGQVSAADWEMPLWYAIAVPPSLPRGKILRVVLTWDSNPSLASPVNELSDLDLSVAAPGKVKTSASYNSNVEIVHFTPYELKPGGVLEAKIHKTAYRIPEDATADHFYYSLAWDWVDNHAP